MNYLIIYLLVEQELMIKYRFNIEKFYYGNTKEDAEKIGFRDKFI